MKPIIAALREQGFTCVIVTNGHWKVTSPDGRSCQIPATPRQGTTVLNAVTRLKRIGFVPPRKKQKKKS